MNHILAEFLRDVCNCYRHGALSAADWLTEDLSPADRVLLDRWIERIEFGEIDVSAAEGGIIIAISPADHWSWKEKVQP